MAKIIMKTGSHAGMEFEVTDGLLIGRRLEVPIHLNDPKSSREHAKIVVEGGTHVLVDLSSTNGTFVNGSRVPRARLTHGDTIRIGRTEMLYNDPTAKKEAPPPPAAQAPAPPPPPPAPAQPKVKINVPPPKKIGVKLTPGKKRSDRFRK